MSLTNQDYPVFALKMYDFISKGNCLDSHKVLWRSKIPVYLISKLKLFTNCIHHYSWPFWKHITVFNTQIWLDGRILAPQAQLGLAALICFKSEVEGGMQCPTFQLLIYVNTSQEGWDYIREIKDKDNCIKRLSRVTCYLQTFYFND